MSTAKRIDYDNKKVASISPIVGNRVPPNSTEAEVAVLGAMMLNKQAISKATELLSPDSFYSQKHKLIYESIIALSEKNETVDIITLSEHLTKNGNLEDIGGRGYLAKINKEVATAANVEQYSLIVLEKQLRRDLIQSSGEVINNAYDDSKDILTEIDKAESEIFRIAEKRMTKNYQGMRELTKETYRQIEQMRVRSESGLTGVPSGLVDLDKYLGGLQKSELIIIAARPSMGKTALALSIARNLAVEYKKSIAFFSLEMASTQLIIRLLSAEAKINQQKIRTGKISSHENQKIIDSLGKLNDAKIYFDDSSMIEIMELRAKCRRLKAEHNIDAVFVDYLQLVRASGMESREREISIISMTLKQIAKELEIPVIALAQLNRSIESRPGKSRSPMLSDLRESGSIEQDADVILFVQRAEVYGQMEYEDKTPTEGTAEIIIGKQRNGPIGTVRIAFQKNYARFENLSYGYEEMPESPGTPNDDSSF
jgi:replicative DNA helicase